MFHAVGLGVSVRFVIVRIGNDRENNVNGGSASKQEDIRRPQIGKCGNVFPEPFRVVPLLGFCWEDPCIMSWGMLWCRFAANFWGRGNQLTTCDLPRFIANDNV